jgi:hypothetical protein
MSALGVLPRTLNLGDLPIRPNEHVNDVLVVSGDLGNRQILSKREMPTLKEHPARTERLDALGHRLKVSHRPYSITRRFARVCMRENEKSLGHVGREDSGVREKVLNEMLHGVFGQQCRSRR